jgi:hypothetical protein
LKLSKHDPHVTKLFKALTSEEEVNDALQAMQRVLTDEHPSWLAPAYESTGGSEAAQGRRQVEPLCEDRLVARNDRSQQTHEVATFTKTDREDGQPGKMVNQRLHITPH